MPLKRLPRVDTLATYQREESWRTDMARAFDHPVLFWLTRGQGRFMINCRLRGIGPNTAIWLPRDTLFSYTLFAKPEGLVVSLDNDTNDEAGFPREPAMIKAQTVPDQIELTGTIDALNRELSTLRTGQRRAVKAHTLLLSVTLDRLLTKTPAEDSDQSADVLRKFSRVISIGHRSGKSIGEFAADLKVTPTHLTRLTREALGKPASTLVQERVIHAACEALLTTDRPVGDIASDLGFRSPTYFTRAFQAQTGQSPSDFRKLGRVG